MVICKSNNGTVIMEGQQEECAHGCLALNSTGLLGRPPTRWGGEGRARDDRYIHSLPVFIVFPLFLNKVRTLTKLFIVNKAIGCRELQLKTKTKSLVDK